MKYILSLAASLIAASPALALPLPSSAPAVDQAVAQVQYHKPPPPKYHKPPPKYHRPAYRPPHYGRPRYVPGYRYGAPPHGWHRYGYRPNDWRTRGCVIVGPVWFCP